MKKLTKAQKEKLEQAIKLLNEANVLMQKVIKDDECYYIHTQIENAADDITDWMTDRA